MNALELLDHGLAELKLAAAATHRYVSAQVHYHDADDMLARQQLMRELGMCIVGETGICLRGVVPVFVPVYGFPRELTAAEQAVLLVEPEGRQVDCSSTC